MRLVVVGSLVCVLATCGDSGSSPAATAGSGGSRSEESGIGGAGGSTGTSGTGGKLSSGNGSGGGSGGQASGGAGAGTHCTNGKKDGDETDIDCGGADCPSCSADYKINPPDSCQNQYYYSKCKSGDASSECGGVCQPRNACENAPSKDGKIAGFACSRYMLFSPMMAQAVKDDARANGWPSSSDPPFNYAVVGHDTNTGGIDKAMTGTQPCCECYQLIFDKPFNEGDSANNQSPAPKPLIVQTFNIGATPDSFDIYMGAGGFGAFNGCMESATFKSAAGYFLYDSYPTDGQRNDGGVKFRRYEECRTATSEKASTPASISSAACQDKIAGFCNQANSTKSAILTHTTRDSCIKSNQLDSLYHQNWAVYAKRVGCPENLTRVTGCKLGPEAGLAKVDASITTATQAQSAGFLSGYHTTTMQDCCKPACGWSTKVGGTEGGKKADAQFESIYTCDNSDQPLTDK
jgi:hypothetical protein